MENVHGKFVCTYDGIEGVVIAIDAPLCIVRTEEAFYVVQTTNVAMVSRVEPVPVEVCLIEACKFTLIGQEMPDVPKRRPKNKYTDLKSALTRFCAWRLEGTEKYLRE